MNRLYLVQTRIAYTNIQVSKVGEIGLITLNSPKDLNCLSNAMKKDLSNALIQNNNDKNIKAIVIFSNHSKVFCAGANIKEFIEKMKGEYNHNAFTSFQQIFQQITVPIIAAVDGMALGGGFELALLCDLILCSEKATFGFPQISIGIIPGIGGTQRTPKIFGDKIAKRMVLSGEPISAERAVQLGIGDMVSSINFRQNVIKVVQKIASKSITAIIAAKKSVKFASQSNLNQGLKFQRAVFYPLLTTKGAKQGINAFIEKRKPNFNGI